MVKVVDKGEKICTLSLDGTECSIVFQDDYKYFAVQNDSGSEVNISLSRGFNLGDDGVMSISNGNSVLFPHMKPNVNQFFAKGNGKIQVFASNEPINPFRNAPTNDGGVQASGNPVIMDNLQGGIPFSEITVSGKNLFKYPYSSADLAANGVSFTDNKDGTISANGTATDVVYFNIANGYTIPLKGGVQYTLSLALIGDYDGYCDLVMQYVNDDGTAGFLGVNNTDKKTLTFTPAKDTDFRVWFRINTGVTVNCIVYPQLELGDTATAYEPPITGRELTVNVSGKNLIRFPYVYGDIEISGIVYTVDENGFITVEGTATKNSWFILNDYIMFPAGTYTFSKFGTDMEEVRLLGVTKSGTLLKNTFSIDKPTEITLRIAVWQNKSVEKHTFAPQLEIGNTATEYEPYSGSVTTITPDTNPYTFPNDIRQQDGLNVVTVSEGELSVVGVQKNAAIKRIWDDMSMDLLFDGLALLASPAEIDLGNYSKYLINCYIVVADGNNFTVSIIVERDRLKRVVDDGVCFVHSWSTTATLEMHFSGAMDNARYYAKQTNQAEVAVCTRIYGIK